MLFPIVTDASCHMHILNTKRLSMLPYVKDFLEAGISHLRIEARFYTTQELKRILHLYKEQAFYEGKHTKEVERDMRKLEGEDITRGHYFRGVE